MVLNALIEKKNKELSDEVCILNFSKLNDESAFNCLVKRYSKSIRRIIYTVIRGSEEDLEDVEQEVLMALYNGLPKFSFKSSFSTYLYRMCRNKSIDFLRKNKRKKEEIEQAFNYSETSDKNTPESIYMNKLEKNSILNSIFQLNEKDRSILLMKDVEDLSLVEIAGIFNKPVGTIKSRLHRARKKAAEKILEEKT
ncbi:MAG: RNA polymerase sigma factor [Spirochaetales bacterium]|nr:RNA polymerase sigma factor [Spirochaetales bacterium]